MGLTEYIFGDMGEDTETAVSRGDTESHSQEYVFRRKVPFAPEREPKQTTSHGWKGLAWMNPWAKFDNDTRPDAARPAEPPGFSLLTKLLIILTPFLLYAGYHTYSQVFGAVTISKTLDTTDSLSQGLVGHWTFDGPNMDLSSTTAEVRDVSGYNNHGDWQYYGPGTSTVMAGRLGQGMWSKLFYVSSAPRIKVATSSVYDNMTALSLSAWVKFPESGSNGGVIIQKGNQRWGLSLSRGSVGQFLVDCVTLDLLLQWVTTSDSDWFHVIVTWDGSDSYTGAHIYVDGSEVNYFTTNSCISRKSDTGLPIYLGYDSNSVSSFGGTYDDVRIYNRVLSAAEIEKLYKMGEGTKINVTATSTRPGSTLGDGLVGHWTFDGPDMNWASTTAEALDVSGNKNHGNVFNFDSKAATIGKVGQAMNFSENSIDGKRISLPTGRFDNVTQRTLAFWMKPKAGGASGQKLISKSLWRLEYYWGGGYLSLNEPFSSQQGWWWSPSGKIKNNEWTHVVVAYDKNSSTNDPVFYINGVAQTNTEILNPSGTYTSDVGFNLFISGDANEPGSVNYAGALDDVRIYNRILSADEVAQLYEETSGSKIKICKEESVQDADANTYYTIAIGSQCWLDRNMNVGTRINISSTQTNNGTIEKYCYSDTLSNCTDNHPNRPDGGLYQWNEAMQYSTTEGARGICPAGFHIPSDAEWHTLEKFLTDNGQTCNPSRTTYGCTPSGAKMKTGGSSNFEGNFAGYGYPSTFGFRNSFGLFWSSTESGTNAIYRYLVSGTGAQVARNAFDKTDSYSVRCIQD